MHFDRLFGFTESVPLSTVLGPNPSHRDRAALEACLARSPILRRLAFGSHMSFGILPHFPMAWLRFGISGGTGHTEDLISNFGVAVTELEKLPPVTK